MKTHFYTCFLWRGEFHGSVIYWNISFLTTHTCQKSLEEEKKEHVEKAKELQKWVSNISKTLRDGEKAGKSPFSKQKVFTEVLVNNNNNSG